ncbi:hypothetical protein IWZ00DRAFT_264195 [Phyllosticta capitalensis]|uniref:uncharacterized protein n=1 Tax=Phyllosticta capitalensis TaxID=121624 RepID=UPI00312D4556
MDSEAGADKMTAVSEQAPSQGATGIEIPIKEEGPQEAVLSNAASSEQNQMAPSNDVPDNETPIKEEEDDPQDAVSVKAIASEPIQVVPSDALMNAIRRSNLRRLQAALENICRQSEVANALVERQLLVPIRPPKNDASVPQQGTKRQRTRYPMCKNCREEYDVTKNADDACKYHPGEMDYIESYWWEDQDKALECLMDHDSYKEYDPEGFMYNCCSGFADSKGCHTGRHREAKHFQPQMKRFKWDDEYKSSEEFHERAAKKAAQNSTAN